MSTISNCNLMSAGWSVVSSLAVCALLFQSACSSSDSGGGESNVGGAVGSTGGRPTAGTAGTLPEAGGSGGRTDTAAAGAGDGGAAIANAGAGGGGAPSAGTGGAGSSVAGASGGGATGGGLSSKSFVCTQVMGVSSVTAWFGGGFEMEPGIEGAKWQAMATHAAFVEKWTDPNNAVWDLALQSPCTQSSKSPDRIIFNPVNWKDVTEAEWETAIDKVIPTLKAKYPAVKRIELITMVRSPNNPTPCTMGGNSVEQTVSAALDQAIVAVAAKSGGLVTVGPQLVAPSCSVFSGTTANFNSSSYGAVAKMVAAAFSAEP